MSSRTTHTDRGGQARMRKIMSVVDRVGLGLMYSLVVAALPVAALGIFTRSV